MHLFAIQNRVFKVPKGKFLSRIYRYITVTRAGVVLYKDNTVTVAHKGKIRYRIRNIKVLQVQNRIEGYLKFYGSASPRGRTFPGYGNLPFVLIYFVLHSSYPLQDFYRSGGELYSMFRPYWIQGYA